MALNFRKYPSVTEIIVPQKVRLEQATNLCNSMQALKIGNIISGNIIYMYNTYRHCTNLTTTMCGPNVTDMS